MTNLLLSFQGDFTCTERCFKLVRMCSKHRPSSLFHNFISLNETTIRRRSGEVFVSHLPVVIGNADELFQFVRRRGSDDERHLIRVSDQHQSRNDLNERRRTNFDGSFRYLTLIGDDFPTDEKTVERAGDQIIAEGVQVQGRDRERRRFFRPQGKR